MPQVRTGIAARLRRAVARRVKESLFARGYYQARLCKSRFPGVAVLCYHGLRDGSVESSALPFADLHVAPEEFEAHCRFLAAACHPISLGYWADALAGRARLPERPVLITFDDGYRSVSSSGAPALARYGIPAALFACSGPIGSGRRFWHDAVARRWGEQEVDRRKGLPYAEWQSLCERDAEAAASGEPCAPLSVDELRALSAIGLFEVGAHSCEHPILARAEQSDQWREIAASKKAVEEWTGRPARGFAYPNGRPGVDYGRIAVRLVAEAGFAFGFSTASGFAAGARVPLECPRFLILAGTSAAELAHRLLWSWPR